MISIVFFRVNNAAAIIILSVLLMFSFEMFCQHSILSAETDQINASDSTRLKDKITELQKKSYNLKIIINDLSESGEYVRALNFQETLIRIQDSLSSLEKMFALLNMQFKLEDDQRKNDIIEMNANNEAQEAFIDRQKIQRYIITAGGVFLVLFILGLYSRLRFLRKAKIKMEVQNRKIESEKLKAQESEQIKTQFLSKMSHEIRTPLNSIMGMSYLMKKNEHIPDQEKYIDAIWKSSQNLLVILNDILDLSGLESGKIIMEKIPFQPLDELMKLRELLKYKAEEKGIELKCKLDEDIPAVLIGDPVRLNQILLNLTGNAIKFTEKGSVQVDIRLKNLINNTALLEVKVSDTGIGIAQDRIDKIFESFIQADSETTRKYGGTGLGLTISKQLIELQNGNISVESNPGQGSVFTFNIPFEIGKPSMFTGTQHLGESLIFQGTRILLVEDNEFNILLVTEEIKGFIQNSTIDLASDGKEAIERVSNHQYDLILMDIEMVGMNGYEAARIIRKMDKPKNAIPIIAMTANAMKGDIQKCFDAGMNEFISKPFNPDDLRKKISALINEIPVRNA